MIGSLRGTLLDRAPEGEVLVEVSGVGYRVHVSPSTLVSLGPVGSQCFLHCHHVQREDAQLLYGFMTLDERRLFEALLTAQGVGPAMAVAVLSHFSPSDLRMVVAAGDVDRLKQVKGVGAKTAARMVIDLKSKLQLPDGDLAAVVSGGDSGNGGGAGVVSGVLGEVRSALASLGYAPDEVKAATTDLPLEDGTAVALKAALQSLAVRR